MAAQGFAGEIFEDAAGADGFADGFGKGLAFFGGQQLAHRFLALDDQGAGLVQHVGAHFREAGTGPSREGRCGRLRRPC